MKKVTKTEAKKIMFNTLSNQWETLEKEIMKLINANNVEPDENGNEKEPSFDDILIEMLNKQAVKSIIERHMTEVLKAFKLILEVYGTTKKTTTKKTTTKKTKEYKMENRWKDFGGKIGK